MTILLSFIVIILLFIAVKLNSLYFALINNYRKDGEDFVDVLNEKIEERNEEDIMKAEELVRREKKASTSFLQSKLYWGYNRAARAINELEDRGIIGPPKQGERYREVLEEKD